MQKDLIESSSVDRVTRPWAIAAILGGIFTERFIFYAALNVFSLHFAQLGEDGTAIEFLQLSNPMLSIAPILLGLLMDTLLERRIPIVLGGALMGTGLLLLAGGSSASLMLGMSLFVIGTSACKVGSLSYMGYLWPRAGLKIEGGFALVWTAINLGAFLSSFAAGWWYSNYREYGDWLTILGVLGLLMASGMGVLALIGALPALPKLKSLKTPSRTANFTGLGMMALGVLLISGLFLLLDSLLPVPQGKMVLHGLLLLVLVLGLGVFTLKDAGNRRSIPLLLLGLAFLVVGATQSIPSNSLMGDGMWKMHDASMTVGLLLSLSLTTLLWLIFSGLRDARQGDFSSMATLMVVGVVLSTVGPLLLLATPFLGAAIVMVSALVSPFGDMFFGPLIYALAWRLAPDHLKATGIGFLVSIAGFRGLVSDVFERPYQGSAADLVMPAVGIVVLGVLGIGFILGVRIWLRRQGGGELLG